MTAPVAVTVVIAARNAEQTLARAIASALAQDGVALEVIVIDDASTDATAHVVRGFADPRLRMLCLDRNAGAGAARNAALPTAVGDWIAVLDADDTMLPGRLRTLVVAAERHELDVVADNMWIERPGHPRTLLVAERLCDALAPIDLPGFARANHLFMRRRGLGYLQPMIRAEMLRAHAVRYDPALRVGEDFILMAELLVLGAHVGRLRDAGYVYTAGHASVSARLEIDDVEAMIAADRRLLARRASVLGAEARAALALHLRSLEDGAAFLRMLDDVRARDVIGLARRAGRRPRAVRHFALPLRARLARAGLTCVG
jgi:succinoglycan biosynthesis protein ExoO